MLQEWIAISTGLLMLAAVPPYLIDIFKGKTKPERTTWFIWSVLGTIAFISQISLHGGWSLVFIGIDGLGNIAVFLLSIKYGVGGWTRLDKIALAIALVGVVVSVLARQPVLAIMGVIVADAAGTILTIRKAFLQPSTETSITWFAIGTASLLSAVSVGAWRWSVLIYPLYLSLANYSVLIAKFFGLGLGRK